MTEVIGATLFASACASYAGVQFWKLKRPAPSRAYTTVVWAKLVFACVVGIAVVIRVVVGG